MGATVVRSVFGTLLREWRGARRLTQEDLADAAEVSVRHLSFLETGRSRASREMVLVLASALELPLRERNTLLGAAGFAAAYPETPLGTPLDVVAAELRVEACFPLDDATDAHMRALARQAGG